MLGYNVTFVFLSNAVKHISEAASYKVIETSNYCHVVSLWCHLMGSCMVPIRCTPLKLFQFYLYIPSIFSLQVTDCIYELRFISMLQTDHWVTVKQAAKFLVVWLDLHSSSKGQFWVIYFNDFWTTFTYLGGQLTNKRWWRKRRNRQDREKM